jgi:hypothetical protein
MVLTDEQVAEGLRAKEIVTRWASWIEEVSQEMEPDPEGSGRLVRDRAFLESILERLQAAEAERDRFSHTSDAQAVAWKERALKAEAERDEARKERHILHSILNLFDDYEDECPVDFAEAERRWNQHRETGVTYGRNEMLDRLRNSLRFWPKDGCDSEVAKAVQAIEDRARREAFEEAKAAMCPYCAEKRPLHDDPRGPYHTDVGRSLNWDHCKAAPLRALAEVER